MILDVCAKNLPSHTTPVSIAALLRPRDVRPDLPVFFGKDREVGPAECAERSAAPPKVVRSVLDREVKFCKFCFLKF